MKSMCPGCPSYVDSQERHHLYHRNVTAQLYNAGREQVMDKFMDQMLTQPGQAFARQFGITI